jgi:hypothetical protein
MSKTATDIFGAPAQEGATNTSTNANPPRPGWQEAVLYPWHLRSAVDPGGNEATDSEERAWARLARKARKSWMRDNPY